MSPLSYEEGMVLENTDTQSKSDSSSLDTLQVRPMSAEDVVMKNIDARSKSNSSSLDALQCDLMEMITKL